MAKVVRGFLIFMSCTIPALLMAEGRILVPTIGVYDEGNFLTKTSSFNFTGAGVSASSNTRGGITVNIAGGGASSGSGDNLGTHIATKTLVMGSNAIIGVSSMSVGASSSTALVSVSTSNGYLDPLFSISTGATKLFEVTGTSVILGAQTFIGGLDINLSSWTLELGKDWEYLNFSSAVVTFASMTNFGKVIFDASASSGTVMMISAHIPKLAGANFNVVATTFQTVSTGTMFATDTEKYTLAICTQVVNGSSITATSMVFIDTVEVTLNTMVGGTGVVNGVSNVTLTNWSTDLGSGDMDIYIRLIRTSHVGKINSWLRYAKLAFMSVLR